MEKRHEEEWRGTAFSWSPRGVVDNDETDLQKVGFVFSKVAMALGSENCAIDKGYCDFVETKLLQAARGGDR